VKPLSVQLVTITPLRNIREVNTRAGLLELVLGVGTIVVTTIGRRITWPHLADHKNVAERLRQKKGTF
jgi:hypothetical protein